MHVNDINVRSNSLSRQWELFDDAHSRIEKRWRRDAGRKIPGRPEKRRSTFSSLPSAIFARPAALLSIVRPGGCRRIYYAIFCDRQLTFISLPQTNPFSSFLQRLGILQRLQISFPPKGKSSPAIRQSIRSSPPFAIFSVFFAICFVSETPLRFCSVGNERAE